MTKFMDFAPRPVVRELLNGIGEFDIVEDQEELLEELAKRFKRPSDEPEPDMFELPPGYKRRSQLVPPPVLSPAA